MRAFMEKVADRKIGERNTDPVVAVFEERFEETFKVTCRRKKNTCTMGAEPPYGRWDQGLYQNWATCRPQQASVLHCYKDASHLCCCRPSLIHQGHIAGTHKETWNFVCLQGHIKTFTCQCEECCLLLQPWMSGTWCDICTEQTLMKAAKVDWAEGERETVSFWPQMLGAHPQSFIWC